MPSLTTGSLLTLRLGRRRFSIVPLWPLVYLMGVLVFLVALLFVLDRKMIPEAVAKGEIVTPAWINHTFRVNDERRRSVIADDQAPIWRSRGYPVTVERKKAHRILVLGDSFAFGTALANINDVWWRQLERELERRGYHDVEVLAVAREGASTRNELGYARRVVPVYKPDLLIWGYVTNDPDEGRIKMSEELPKDDTFEGALAFVPRTLPHVAQRVTDLRMIKKHDQRRASGLYNYVDWELKLIEPDNLRYYLKTLREVKQFQEEQHVPGFFASLPSTEVKYMEPRYKPLDALFRTAGLEWHNFLPEFKRRFGTFRPYRFSATVADGHPGAMTTHFLAVQVADVLERDHRQILGAKSAAPPALPRVNDWIPVVGEDRSREQENIFSFDYPLHDWELPFMPVDMSYEQLNLERPVALSRVTVTGPNLVDCMGWYTSIGAAGYDDGTMHPLPAHKKQCVWNLTGLPDSTTINTIRIHADVVGEMNVPMIEGRERIRLHGPYQPFGGFGWACKLPPALAMVASTEADQHRSTLVLTENGAPMGPTGELHDRLRALGSGRYSHWGEYLFFSAKDNSNPNTNNKTYEIDVEKIVSHPRRLTVEMTPPGALATTPATASATTPATAAATTPATTSAPATVGAAKPGAGASHP